MPAILIVEDHDQMLFVLGRLLRQKGHMSIAGAVKSAEEALTLLPELDEVDLVLVDISLPGKNGIELVAEIKKEYPSLPCLILSGHEAQHYVRNSLEAGASGYISKQNTEAIVEGIRSVLSGNLYLSKDLQGYNNNSITPY